MKGVWFIEIYNSDCPYLKEETKCTYPNKMYCPKICDERACPIKNEIRYTD